MRGACTNACRQIAYRRCHIRPQTEENLAPARRRGKSVYECSECEHRYLGEQWCPDCNRPCRRLGTGGHCLNCDEPLTVNDLINTT